MEESSANYKWSDAWFLLAISYASRNGEPASLSTVIGAADYINHAILTVAEIKSATFKLTRDEWIRYEDGEFSATEKMIARFSKLPGKSPMSQMEIVELWLNATAFEGDDDPNVLTAPDFAEITEEMVDMATAEYKK
jgi:hypothetical protein